MEQGYGLTVRWSLRGTAPELAQEVAQQLREYVVGTSLARFTGMPGLRFKTWGMVEGEAFWGSYVWATETARAEFLERFRANAATAPVSQLVGAEPDSYEEYEVIAVAQGAAPPWS